jgi:hypothetical protein
MIELGKHFQNLPGQPVLALDRLIGIGVGAKRDGLRPVGRV